MRILQITAGAASMYCGSCLKDNALAAEMMALGHHVVLLPFYTPTLTDERNVSSSKVFFGGISVYLQQSMPLFRKLPRFFDKLLDSDFALRWAARQSIAVDPKFLGEMTVMVLEGSSGPLGKEFSKLTEWLALENHFDVICIPYTLLISLAPSIRRVAPRSKIVCELQGEDLFLDGLIEPYRSQAMDLIRKQLHQVDLYISVSGYYAEFMSKYLGLDPARIAVTPIGIHSADFHAGEPRTEPPYKVGFFARIAPEKGLLQLCEAYRLLRQMPGVPQTSLEAAGYLLTEHEGYLAGIKSKMKDWGLSDEFQYHGALDREAKVEFLRGLDVFSVPSVYHEPKGLFLLEAMASGVPVVQPSYGAYPELLMKTGGGVLVEPNNPQALAEGLYEFLINREAAAQAGKAGAEGVVKHFTARRMAEQTVKAFERALH